MVLGYHFIFSAYGFWLPNDPRGSWSDTIRVYELLQFGPATKINATESVAHAPHDRALRLKAKQALRYDPVHFTGIQARAIARGLKAKATMRLNAEGLHPLADHPRADGTLPSSWARNYWCPFIDSVEYLTQAISYVENNPVRCGLKAQAWNCVVKPPRYSTSSFTGERRTTPCDI